MGGYWIKGKSCGQCQKQEGRSPQGYRSRGIDETGICENCRYYNANKWECPFCQVPVEWNQRGVSVNGITQAVTRGHLTCLTAEGLKPHWAGR